MNGRTLTPLQPIPSVLQQIESEIFFRPDKSDPKSAPLCPPEPIGECLAPIFVVREPVTFPFEPPSASITFKPSVQPLITSNDIAPKSVKELKSTTVKEPRNFKKFSRAYVNPGHRCLLESSNACPRPSSTCRTTKNPEPGADLDPLPTEDERLTPRKIARRVRVLLNRNFKPQDQKSDHLTKAEQVTTSGPRRNSGFVTPSKLSQFRTLLTQSTPSLPSLEVSKPFTKFRTSNILPSFPFIRPRNLPASLKAFLNCKFSQIPRK